MITLKTSYTKEIVCPHCGYEHPDSWDHQIQGCAKIECDDCHKEFLAEIVTEVSYSSRKVDE